MPRVHQDNPHCCIATWICMCSHTRDTVICSRFHYSLFEVLEPQGVKICRLTLVTGFYNSLYNCIKGASGKVIVDDKGIKDSWKEYMEKVMNEENE